MRIENTTHDHYYERSFGYDAKRPVNTRLWIPSKKYNNAKYRFFYINDIPRFIIVDYKDIKRFKSYEIRTHYKSNTSIVDIISLICINIVKTVKLAYRNSNKFSWLAKSNI